MHTLQRMHRSSFFVFVCESTSSLVIKRYEYKQHFKYTRKWSTIWPYSTRVNRIYDYCFYISSIIFFFVVALVQTSLLYKKEKLNVNICISWYKNIELFCRMHQHCPFKLARECWPLTTTTTMMMLLLAGWEARDLLMDGWMVVGTKPLLNHLRSVSSSGCRRPTVSSSVVAEAKPRGVPQTPNFGAVACIRDILWS